MQRWEYHTITTYAYNWADSIGRTGRLPREGPPMYGDPTGMLNELGEQGWELIGVAARAGGDCQLFLKRPKS
jgi:hypothetical protein